ncbi:MAG: hypothetical protein K2X87_06755 [Gemmataceae bacterium]|nr:hypothetical protein [Gemmataceae bacterium]
MPVRLAVLLTLSLAGRTLAQPVTLAEVPQPGECSRYAVDLDVSGTLSVLGDGGKPQSLKLQARAKHRFADRTLAVADGQPARSVRHHVEATASSVVGGEKSDRTLAADRRLIVTARKADGPLAFSPAGPLTRDELDLVTEHFDPAGLPGLLPGKEVKVGDTWAITNPAARVACLFDGLTANQLTGKLTGVADGLATFEVTGTAEGIENGAKVSVTVSATGTFDVAAKRVTGLAWKQTDDRGAGPVSPASKVEATITLKREPLAVAPPGLADAALAGLPPGDPPAQLTALRHADPKGRYRLVYPRGWHVTGQTDTHLVLRLLDAGEFVAQATVSTWRKAEPGKHSPPEEFKKAIADSPGWTATTVFEDGEVALDGGRWLYRVVAAGTSDGRPVAHAFHLLAGPNGDQVAVTFALHPDKLKALAGRDLELVRGIEVGR